MNNRWGVSIERVENGFIVRYKGAEDGVEVYGDEKDDVQAMFMLVLEFFNELGSKHDKKRMFVCYVNDGLYWDMIEKQEELDKKQGD